MTYTFCERFKELREERKLSYKQMAKLIGFSDTALGKWEKGKQIPTIETLIRLCKFFNVSADYLLGLED